MPVRNRFPWSVVTAFFLLTVAAPATATLIPIPPGFLPDNGATIFSHEDLVLTLEQFELPAVVGFSSFGFFFESNPGTLITVFDATDQAPPDQTAAIDFTLSKVFDTDAGVLQTDFAGAGPGNIGFYLTLGGLTLHSLPSLNPGGIDPVATFPKIGNPSIYIIGFENPAEPGQVLALEIGVGLRKVPEPSTTLLFGLGLALVVARRRRER